MCVCVRPGGVLVDHSVETVVQVTALQPEQQQRFEDIRPAQSWTEGHCSWLTVKSDDGLHVWPHLFSLFLRESQLIWRTEKCVRKVLEQPWRTVEEKQRRTHQPAADCSCGWALVLVSLGNRPRKTKSLLYHRHWEQPVNRGVRVGRSHVRSKIFINKKNRTWPEEPVSLPEITGRVWWHTHIQFSGLHQTGSEATVNTQNIAKKSDWTVLMPHCWQMSKSRCH